MSIELIMQWIIAFFLKLLGLPVKYLIKNFRFLKMTYDQHKEKRNAQQKLSLQENKPLRKNL